MELIRHVPGVWSPPPMTDSSSQIRLLWIHAGHGDDEIRCTVSVWDLEDAPEFRAISYTWGAPDPGAFVLMTSMTTSYGGYGFGVVDCIRVRVRDNARYALWQARLHDPNSHLWIDSLCINQTDLREKTAQVSMMAEIYTKAEMVLACVGPSVESSHAIHELCHRLHDEVPDDAYEYREFVRGWKKLEWDELCEMSIGPELGVKLMDQWLDFSSREYWSRLWIIQELHNGWCKG
ncbi:hypothetical protein CBER1_03478 [Cercospora berteroae]|uniref:Heterokaryon incompatibility domain-containing protein n=1 Tax=Cercospora berteroae TaxID=357750 RepID=A0A2S6CLW8_9PEZI|nr:hypothetical protein CBER1_03478 [Cercospora berteroae]